MQYTEILQAVRFAISQRQIDFLSMQVFDAITRRLSVLEIDEIDLMVDFLVVDLELTEDQAFEFLDVWSDDSKLVINESSYFMFGGTAVSESLIHKLNDSSYDNQLLGYYEMASSHGLTHFQDVIMNRLFLNNQEMIMQIIHYCLNIMPIESLTDLDLLSVGFGLSDSRGFRRAVIFYRRGTKSFHYYASICIRSAIQEYISQYDRMIRLPKHFGEHVAEYQRLYWDSVRQFNRVDLDWIFDQMNISHSLFLLAQYWSGDVDVYNSKLYTQHTDLEAIKDDVVIFDRMDEPYDMGKTIIDKSFSNEILTIIFNSLAPTEFEIINLRFGLTSGQPMLLDDVAHCLDITYSHAVYLQTLGFKHARNALQRNGIGYTDALTTHFA